MAETRDELESCQKVYRKICVFFGIFLIHRIHKLLFDIISFLFMSNIHDEILFNFIVVLYFRE